jgi:hypothetical protein
MKKTKTKMVGNLFFPCAWQRIDEMMGSTVRYFYMISEKRV